MAIFRIIFLFFFIFIVSINDNLYAKTIESKSGNFKLKEVKFSDLIGWDNENFTLPLKAFLKSCNQIKNRDEDDSINSELYKIKIKDLANTCNVAGTVDKNNKDAAKEFFEKNFSPFLVIDNDKDEYGLFTGYYITTINGSRVKNETYKYPIYKRPNNLDYTREEINNGALDGEGLEIFYTDDKVDLAFLQIQGSGIIRLEDGTEITLSYDGKNNYEYTSIGKIIAKYDYMEGKNINAITIKEWLKNNPDKIDEILNQNKSYIFFKENKGGQIRGAHGSILTAYRSIAVDDSYMPYGFPFWLDTKINFDKKVRELRRIVISQDTGSAIKGVVRGDIFFGDNEKAEKLASHMVFKGKYYILLPKSVSGTGFIFLRKW